MTMLLLMLVCVTAVIQGAKEYSESSFGDPGDECPESCLCPFNQTTTGECTEGCMAGYYGYNCNKTCDPRCKTNFCLQDGGHCVCELGYLHSNSRCEKDTGKQCRAHLGCLNDRCSSTGDEECTEGCKPGLFGASCESPCGGNCFCDQESGKCTDCVPGWFGPECQSQCSSGCTEGCYKNGSCIDGCKPGAYGEQCDMPCSRQCVSGCDQLSGECVQCEAGRYGPTCQSECSAGCAGCDREGSCIKGCVKGYYGETCMFICPQQCNDGLCDLNGSCNIGCMKGYYGEKCESTCPQQCDDDPCDLDGTCATCKTGFYGPRCTNKADDRTDWMPYIIGGGVLLMVMVLAVCMVCCLKRMQGIVDNGMKSIGENSVVHFGRGPTASVYSLNNTRVCESNHESVDPTYNHLFTFKPFSVDSSFDDLETASGYCSVLLHDSVVIMDGHDTQSATSLAEVMFDEEGACSVVQKEDVKAKKTCEIIFLQSQEFEEGVLRDGGNGNARNVRDIEVVDLSKLTNVDAAHAGIRDLAGGTSGLRCKEDGKMEEKVIKIISLKTEGRDDDICKHDHIQDSEDMDLINPIDDNKSNKLMDEKEALRRTRGQKCKVTQEDAGDDTFARGEADLIERVDTPTVSGVQNAYAISKLASEVAAGGGVQREEAHCEGRTTTMTWEGLQPNNKEVKEDGARGGTINGEGNDWSIIVDDEDIEKKEFSNDCSCNRSTQGIQLQSHRGDLLYDGSQQSPRKDNIDPQRKSSKKKSDRYPYVDIIVT